MHKVLITKIRNNKNKIFMAHFLSKDFICFKCKNIAKDPIECKNCYIIYCPKCSHDINECLKCKDSIFKGIIDQALRNIVKEMKYLCPKGCGKRLPHDDMQFHYNQCQFNQMICSLCSFSAKKELFLLHLIEHHKEDIIKQFNRTKDTFPSSIDPAPVHIGSNGIKYCNKPNNLNCSSHCCNGICSENNCLCVSCMKRNVKENQLEKEQLINKAGVVSTKSQYYYCLRNYSLTRKINNKDKLFNFVCNEPNSSCPNCLPLNFNEKKYIN